MLLFISVGSFKHCCILPIPDRVQSERMRIRYRNNLVKCLLFWKFTFHIPWPHICFTHTLSPNVGAVGKMWDCSGAGPPGPLRVPPAAWSNKTINCVHFKYQAGLCWLPGDDGEGECTLGVDQDRDWVLHLYCASSISKPQRPQPMHSGLNSCKMVASLA